MSDGALLKAPAGRVKKVLIISASRIGGCRAGVLLFPKGKSTAGEGCLGVCIWVFD